MGKKRLVLFLSIFSSYQFIKASPIVPERTAVKGPNFEASPGRDITGNFVTKPVKRALNWVDKKLTTVKVPEIKEAKTQDDVISNIDKFKKSVDSVRTTFSRETRLDQKRAELFKTAAEKVQEQIDTDTITDANVKTLQQERLNSAIQNLNKRSLETATADTAFNEKQEAKKANTVARRFAVPVGLKTGEENLGNLLPRVKEKKFAVPFTEKVLSVVKNYKDSKGSIDTQSMKYQYQEMRNLKNLNEKDAAKMQVRAKQLSEKVSAIIPDLEKQTQDASDEFKKLKTQQDNATGVKKWASKLSGKDMLDTYLAEKKLRIAEKNELTAKLIKENYDRQVANLSDTANNSEGKLFTENNPELNVGIAKAYRPYKNTSSVLRDMKSVLRIEDKKVRDQLLENMGDKIDAMPDQGRYMIDTYFKDDYTVVRNVESLVKDNNENAQFIVGKLFEKIKARADQSGFIANHFSDFKYENKSVSLNDMQNKLIDAVDTTYKKVLENRREKSKKVMEEVDKEDWEEISSDDAAQKPAYSLEQSNNLSDFSSTDTPSLPTEITESSLYKAVNSLSEKNGVSLNETFNGYPEIKNIFSEIDKSTTSDDAYSKYYNNNKEYTGPEGYKEWTDRFLEEKKTLETQSTLKPVEKSTTPPVPTGPKPPSVISVPASSSSNRLPAKKARLNSTQKKGREEFQNKIKNVLDFNTGDYSGVPEAKQALKNDINQALKQGYITKDEAEVLLRNL